MTLPVNIRNIDHETIRTAADAIRRGELVIFPSDAEYVIAANAFDESAVRRLRNVTDTPSLQWLTVLVAGLKQLNEVAEYVPDGARHLAEKYWPGPLALVADKFNVRKEVTGGGERVPIHAPLHPVAQALLQELKMPLAAAPACSYGDKPPLTAEKAADAVGRNANVTLDAGLIGRRRIPTLVDVSAARPQVLKVGEIPAEDVLVFFEQMA